MSHSPRKRSSPDGLPPPHFERISRTEYARFRLALRIWHGMTFSAWRMVIGGNLRHVSPGRYGLVLSVTAFSLFNSAMKLLVDLAYGRHLKQVRIEPDPVFILGHWRSGTTWLNQLMATDPRLASPTGLQVFMPETFLIARLFFKRPVELLMPKKRPMDDVSVSLASVEEDEVALLISGTPGSTRGRGFAGVVDPPVAMDPIEYSEADRRIWRAKWFAFLSKVQWVNPHKRLLLKSPEHSLRIRTILDEFPDAKFVHIVRDPYAVYLSSKRQVSALWATQGLRDQVPDDRYCSEFVLQRFNRFNEQFEEAKTLIADENVISIRYEDLRADAIGVMEEVYRSLDLGPFDPVRPRLEMLLSQQRGYRTNAFSLNAEECARVDEALDEHFAIYGYAKRSEKSM